MIVFSERKSTKIDPKQSQKNAAIHFPDDGCVLNLFVEGKYV